MGKHEAMTPKAIANKIKAKGLQKLKYYCQMCQKQCRDDNGFKCHERSEAHQRQLLLVAENPDKYLSQFSQDFLAEFLYLLRTRFGTRRVLANEVYQEFIKEREHVHMNSTQWTTLSEFANWLGRNSHCKVDHSERGVYITYIDRDPEMIRRQEMEAKKEKHYRDFEELQARTIKKQIELNKRTDSDDLETKALKPIPMKIVPVTSSTSEDVTNTSERNTTISGIEREPKPGPSNIGSEEPAEVELKPVFDIKPFKLSTTITKTKVVRTNLPLLKPIAKKTRIK